MLAGHPTLRLHQHVQGHRDSVGAGVNRSLWTLSTIPRQGYALDRETHRAKERAWRPSWGIWSPTW